MLFNLVLGSVFYDLSSLGNFYIFSVVVIFLKTFFGRLMHFVHIRKSRSFFLKYFYFEAL